MYWSAMPNYIAMVFALIIYSYANDRKYVPTLEKKIFNLLLGSIVFLSFILIAATDTRNNFQDMPAVTVQIVNILSYVFEPFLVVAFAFYIMTIVFEGNPNINRYLYISTIPFTVMVLVAVTNPFTGVIFTIDLQEGFVFGKLYRMAHVTVILYSLIIYGVLFYSRRRHEKCLYRILLMFPHIAIATVALQFVFTHILLAAVSTTAMLLIMTLHLQNKHALLDSLTGLKNREAFQTRLAYNNRHFLDFKMIIIDIDDFKSFNDKYDHGIGDLLLKEIGKFMNSLAYDFDVYRYGSDEFALVLDKGDDEELHHMAHRIKDHFEKAWIIDRLFLTVDVSIAAISIPHSIDMKESLALVEHCMVQSKENPSDMLVHSSRENLISIRRRKKIAESLDCALRTGGFDLYYQPIYNVKKARFTNAEALLRLYDPELGFVSPMEFLPIAEQEGMIIDIGYLTLDKVCRYVKKLEGENIDFEAVSVNYSVIQMADFKFVERFKSIIEEHGVKPTSVRIEITEDAFAENYDRIHGIMDELREYGIKFYLDDFGTGYSNLAAINRLAFDYIKLDKSLLDSAADTNYALLRGPIRTFDMMGIEVVVEGVESKEQRDSVIKYGAQYIQGYVYSQPMSGQETAAFIRGQTPNNSDNSIIPLHSIKI